MSFENDTVYLISGKEINALLDSLIPNVNKNKVEKAFADLRFTLDTKQDFHTKMIFKEELYS